MEKILELITNFKTFIIREFLWLLATVFMAILLTICSLWFINELSIPLLNRIEWQGISNYSFHLIIITCWFITIYLVRLVRGAIIFLILPTANQEESNDDE